MEIRQMNRNTAEPRRASRPSAQDSEDLSRQIQQKAFELYQMRGGAHGDDQADWFEAERIVRQSPGQAVTGSTRPAAPRGNGGTGRTTPARRKYGRRADI
jgi:hypothetical protein